MKLFRFAVGEKQFALRGQEVLQVLPPGEIRTVEGEPGHRFVQRDGDRLPLWQLPGAGDPGAETVEHSTFLRLPGPALLQVDVATGLVDVPEEEVLAVPRYLFPPGRVPYRGLLREQDRLVGLLDSGRLGR